MQTQPPSVYVPVETPDNKIWAFLLALLVHIGILGFILYTNHVKNLDGEAMETTIITPDELAAMQGQIKANQMANSNGNTAPNPTVSMSPEAAKLNAELAQKQVKWQQQQAAIAAELDKQALKEQQDFANQIKQNQIEEMQTLDKFKAAQNTPDVPLPPQKTAQGTVKIDHLDGSSSDSNTTPSQNSGNDGTSKTPSKGNNKAASARYLSIILSKIQSNWTPPKDSKGQSLTAYFQISTTGNISNVSVTGSSDEAFINSLIQAINNSNPLPAPPADNYAEFADNQIDFNSK